MQGSLQATSRKSDRLLSVLLAPHQSTIHPENSLCNNCCGPYPKGTRKLLDEATNIRSVLRKPHIISGYD